jgi:septum formation protein
VTLILASSSPRRRELLQAAGIEFTVQSADVPEVRAPKESPLDYGKRLAHDKASAVAAKNPGAFVLGADTIVLVDDAVLEKPADGADAARMLRLLSNRSHQVVTAVCLIDPRGKAHVESETTDVFFTEMSEQDIADYVATDEPMDKAGAYAIQGIASRWVYRIYGDYSNVVGLPVARVWRMLREHKAV